LNELATLLLSQLRYQSERCLIFDLEPCAKVNAIDHHKIL